MLSTIRVIIDCNAEVCVCFSGQTEKNHHHNRHDHHILARSVTVVTLSRYTFWKMHIAVGSDRHRFEGSFLAKILCGGQQRCIALPSG